MGTNSQKQELSLLLRKQIHSLQLIESYSWKKLQKPSYPNNLILQMRKLA